MRRCHPATALLLALMLAGCGGTSHHPAANACKAAASGHGSLGACAPKQKLGLTAPHRAASVPIYPDRSNNDPCYCGQQIRAQGQVGLIVKANQGTGFIDSTGVSMVQSARAAGLAAGMYDFDQDYTVSEAHVFVSRLHAAGLYPNTPNTFPAYLDVEYGNFNYSGLNAQIAYLRSQGYRVGIYTGEWYWGPHAGCRWPAGVTAWLSGYPNAPVPCGTTGYNAHQFTSTPIDLTAYLGTRAQFDAFVNAGPPAPPPDRYAIYDTTRRHFGNVTASEHSTVATWDRAGCSKPVRRDVCKSSRYHLILLRDRVWVVAHRSRPPAWGRDHLGARFQGLARRAG